MASAWAVMQHLGTDGYRELTRVTLDAADRIRAGVAELDRVQVLGDDAYHLIALAASTEDDRPLDMFAVGDALAADGWFHDRQTPPDSLHSTVSNGNAAVVDDYLSALRSCMAAVGADQTDDRSTNYATLE
jgi:sphinganine-1-phosphate aldolase